MEDKINARLIFIGVLSMILTAAFTLFVFHNAFVKQVTRDVKTSAQTIAAAYPHLEAEGELSAFAVEGLRVTLVSQAGQVLFESGADAEGMENHLSRPEIAAAIASGQGEDRRTSGTLGYETYYYAQKLADGNILRVAMNVKTMYAIYDKAIPAVLLIGLCIVLLSVLMSVFLTKKLVNPIVDMARNIDEIEAHIPYKELAPFAYAIKEQQLKKKEVDRMRQEFTANVSHELKTPLTSISGYAEMIETGLAKEADVKDFARKIHNEAGRLIELIGDIIKLSELEEPGGETELTPVDLREIVESTVDSLYFQAERRGIALTYRGDSGMVLGDKKQLAELVYNLCDNAIRYNRPQGRVEVTVETVPDAVVLTVKDTGIGISKEYQSRIFERFYRVDKSRSKETGGTGLGLAIVKHIALRHHGEISLKSTEGRGTSIAIRFPSYAKEDAE